MVVLFGRRAAAGPTIHWISDGSRAPAPVDISIVLPAHDEAGNIVPMIAALKQVLSASDGAEIICVDDGSTDGTLGLLRATAAADPMVRYVSFTRNFGHEAALRAGLRHARGRAVIVMDCDFEHPPAVIPGLIEQWRAGYKIVAAQRMDRTVDWRRSSVRPRACTIARSAHSATCSSSPAAPISC